MRCAKIIYIRCRAGGGGCACGREQKRGSGSRDGTELIISTCSFCVEGDKQTIERTRIVQSVRGNGAFCFRVVVMKKRETRRA